MLVRRTSCCRNLSRTHRTVGRASLLMWGKSRGEVLVGEAASETAPALLSAVPSFISETTAAESLVIEKSHHRQARSMETEKRRRDPMTLSCTVERTQSYLPTLNKRLGLCRRICQWGNAAHRRENDTRRQTTPGGGDGLPNPTRLAVDVRRRGGYVPLVYQHPARVKQEARFWRVHSFIREYRGEEEFVHAFRLSCRLLGFSDQPLGLEDFTRVLQATVRREIDFVDAYFIFSLLSKGSPFDGGKVDSEAGLENIAPRLFFPLEQFSAVACQHIVRTNVWPSYLFISFAEVEELLENLKAYFWGDDDTYLALCMCVESVLNHLNALGYVNRIALLSLHNVMKRIGPLIDVLNSTIEGEDEDLRTPTPLDATARQPTFI